MRDVPGSRADVFKWIDASTDDMFADIQRWIGEATEKERARCLDLAMVTTDDLELVINSAGLHDLADRITLRIRARMAPEPVDLMQEVIFDCLHEGAGTEMFNLATRIANAVRAMGGDAP